MNLDGHVLLLVAPLLPRILLLGNDNYYLDAVDRVPGAAGGAAVGLMAAATLLFAAAPSLRPADSLSS